MSTPGARRLRGTVDDAGCRTQAYRSRRQHGPTHQSTSDMKTIAAATVVLVMATGCAVASVAGTAVSTTVGVAGTVVGTGVGVTGAVVRGVANTIVGPTSTE
jgi:phosphate/sulfate permease